MPMPVSPRTPKAPRFGSGGILLPAPVSSARTPRDGTRGLCRADPPKAPRFHPGGYCRAILPFVAAILLLAPAAHGRALACARAATDFPFSHAAKTFIHPTQTERFDSRGRTAILYQ